MNKPRMVRRATSRGLRVLVTASNRQPNENWARNCSDFPWTVEDVPLLHIGAAGRAVPFHVALERDTGAVSSFAAIPQQLWGVRVWKCTLEAIVDIFCWSMRCFLVRSWPLVGVIFAWVFGQAHELAVDFHRHQQSQLFGL